MLLELTPTIELKLELELFGLNELVATELLLASPPQTEPVTVGVSTRIPFKSP